MALVMVTACAPQVTAGEVTDKSMEDAYVTQEEIMEEECEWDTDTVTSGTGKNKKTSKVKEYECESVGTGEYEDVEHPAQYEVTLTNDEGDSQTHEVDENQYNSVEEGDFLDLGKDE
jgi:hypothetical protein